MISSSLRVVTGVDDPGIFERRAPVVRAVWPEYNLHGDAMNANWDRLDERFPQFQFVLLDEAGEIAGLGNVVPVVWDGTVEGLPAGIDDALARAVTSDETPNALCALQGAIAPGRQGGGLAAEPVRAMAALGLAAGFADLIAPVRPNWKERYPLTPIDRYAAWTRDDGMPFDPWIRVHARMGARILRPVAESLRITGTVEDWEGWTGMAFPETGSYVFPHGLAPLEVDRETNRGAYWEPNVWMHHQLEG